jgi:hypothetical protein
MSSILEGNDVTVHRSRTVIANHTYPVANITSIHIGHKPPTAPCDDIAPPGIMRR